MSNLNFPDLDKVSEPNNGDAIGDIGEFLVLGKSTFLLLADSSDENIKLFALFPIEKVDGNAANNRKPPREVALGTIPSLND